MLQSLELPLPTESKELTLSNLISWVRTNEVPFLNALTDYGDSMKRGRETIPVNEPGSSADRIFTGSGLCGTASFVLMEGIIAQFGQNVEAAVVDGMVSSFNSHTFAPNRKGTTDSMPHTWLRVKINGEWYFIDPTYGQIKTNLNRIVIDRVEKESVYYGPMKEKDIKIKTDFYRDFVNNQEKHLKMLSVINQDAARRSQLFQNLRQSIKYS